MKKHLALLLTLVLLLTGATPALAASSQVCSPWADSYLYDAEFLRILPEELKGQDQREEITRAEFCSLAYETIAYIRGYVAYYEAMHEAEARGETDILDKLGFETPRLYPDPAPENPFTDTASPAVLALYQAGIIQGKGQGFFAPQDILTRQEAATILGRMANYLSLQTFPFDGSFADRAAIADWAADGVAIVCGMGIMVGLTQDTFGPAATYTREQAVTTMIRMKESVPYLLNHEAVTEDLTCTFSLLWMWVTDREGDLVFRLPRCYPTHGYRNYGYDSWTFLPRGDAILVAAHARDAADPRNDHTTFFDLDSGEALVTLPAKAGYFYGLSKDHQYIITRLTVSDLDYGPSGHTFYSVYGFDGSEHLANTDRWLDLYEAGYVDTEDSLGYTWR